MCALNPATSSKERPRPVRHTIALLGLLLSLAACDRGGPANEVQEAGAGASGKRVTIRTSGGSAVVESGGGTAALPSGLPLYPGAQVTASTIVTGKGRDGPDANAMLSFTSTAAPAEIAAFYKQAAVKAGYRIDGEVTAGDMAMLSATRAGTGFTLTATRAARGSEATLITGRGAPSPPPDPAPLAAGDGSR